MVAVYMAGLKPGVEGRREGQLVEATLDEVLFYSRAGEFLRETSIGVDMGHFEVILGLQGRQLPGVILFGAGIEGEINGLDRVYVTPNPDDGKIMLNPKIGEGVEIHSIKTLYTNSTVLYMKEK